MITTPRSRIYRGTLRHRRFLPRQHSFDYRVWMALLDLDELPALFDGVPGFSARRPALARFRREDYLPARGQQLSLAEAAREEVRERLGAAPEGRVTLLTQLSSPWVSFNPISLYYLYHPADETGEERLGAVLGEVTNTPWRERTRYASAVDGSRHTHRAAFDKDLHVSPFLPMGMTYQWRFNSPGEALFMHMETWRDEQRHFDATLTLEGQPATRGALISTLARQPWMATKTLAAIHWEALKLWLKGVPLHDHPPPAEGATPQPRESQS
ncbi:MULTISPECIES: DUF1365 domain-containing protein [Halomonas]|uniref:DUF1365 domain-containing protein n=1 Tax=Halomonas TaxID=2745 RepID=UPI001C98506E|nr:MULTISPECIES: DUF1365 domain-containing protein [Halomonas]MBY6028014.1 DUF1365 domain-containing protein [Halomonas sp. DP8Y7-1]MBY6206746.1 DUF1365 domain-containing protein [Halomonas sp. DP3Y7-2]MBY6230277.1 DUF1365 domain-containing protein [Halomonas sp. DP3Y7-1]MCA0918406.1 DUF1365 domain-containing protein [Halomonas denitrificans]